MLRGFFVAAPMLLLLLTACGDAPAESEREAVPVVAQRPQMLPEQLEVEAIGSARAAMSAEIFPETAGQVRAVRFAAGDFVSEGQVLVQLDARQARLAVDLAQVQVREAAQLLSRYRRIEDTGALSESQIEAGETALASAQVELQQAQAALADRTVRAPFSGHIGITDVDRGDRIGPDTVVAQLDNRGTLYVDFPAPESAFDRLRAGQVVTVTPFSDTERSIDARIVAVDPAVSAEQRTFIVRTAIPNEGDRLRPGMSFRVRFTGFGNTRPAVPEEAIVWGGEGAYLWTVRDGTAHRVPVTITARREGLVLVDAEIGANDLVIVEGVQSVREGQEVRLVQPSRAETQRVRVRRADGTDSASARQTEAE